MITKVTRIGVSTTYDLNKEIKLVKFGMGFLPTLIFLVYELSVVVGSNPAAVT